jgi:spore germination protein GerM
MHRYVPLVALAILTAGCAGSSSPTGIAPASRPSTSSGASTAAASPEAPTAGGTSARAIYYLRDTTNGPRLYREFHRRAATSGVVRDAVTAMLTEPAQDKDYTSLWPKGTRVLGLRMDGSTAVVDLSSEAQTRQGGAAFESSTLQQLVWTATAADPAVKAVQLLIEGKRVDSLWGHVDTSRPMTRGEAAVELGPVWILTPANGRVARGGTFGGEASVFEATVSWELRQGGKLVKSGYTNAATGAPGRGPWSARADVPPGDYVLRAFESSAKDGSDTFVDDKPLTVT